mmetsp:Transcript_56413/g.155044  ORF Transcript_56413/g.155044 Transcript_56413/m.155044 type:complete len:226 (+) Transcript_56413:3389-4066(+)
MARRMRRPAAPTDRRPRPTTAPPPPRMRVPPPPPPPPTTSTRRMTSACPCARATTPRRCCGRVMAAPPRVAWKFSSRSCRWTLWRTAASIRRSRATWICWPRGRRSERFAAQWTRRAWATAPSRAASPAASRWRTTSSCASTERRCGGTRRSPTISRRAITRTAGASARPSGSGTMRSTRPTRSRSRARTPTRPTLRTRTCRRRWCCSTARATFTTRRSTRSSCR